MRVRVIAAATGVVAVVGGLTLAVVAGASGPPRASVRVVNDTRRPVVLALCHTAYSSHCDEALYRHRLAPGATVEENAGRRGFSFEWALERSDGTPEHCVEVTFAHPTRTAPTVYVSRAPEWMKPCRSYFMPEPASYPLPPVG